MRSIMALHEEFIVKASRPMRFGALPIDAREPEMPIIAVERWCERDGALLKAYRFRRPADRGAFVMGLLAYENDVGHNASISIDQDQVSLRLQTHDLGKPTELDKEYARYADVLFKDLVYSVDHGDEG